MKLTTASVFQLLDQHVKYIHFHFFPSFNEKFLKVSGGLDDSYSNIALPKEIISVVKSFMMKNFHKQAIAEHWITIRGVIILFDMTYRISYRTGAFVSQMPPYQTVGIFPYEEIL